MRGVIPHDVGLVLPRAWTCHAWDRAPFDVTIHTDHPLQSSVSLTVLVARDAPAHEAAP
jgi:hypothetical protein